jgi:anti-sigma B factor antagonist
VAGGFLDFHVGADHAGDVLILAPRGELDLATAPVLADAFADQATVLDLSGLEFIDSTGLATLIGERRRRAEAQSPFVLVRGSTQTQRLFAVTGVEELFTWAASRDEAVALAGNGQGAEPQ